jgi:hypothetical protein
MHSGKQLGDVKMQAANAVIQSLGRHSNSIEMQKAWCWEMEGTTDEISLARRRSQVQESASNLAFTIASIREFIIFIMSVDTE